jgi:hypothetical protein
MGSDREAVAQERFYPPCVRYNNEIRRRFARALPVDISLRLLDGAVTN